jgi:hypothetical protein
MQGKPACSVAGVRCCYPRPSDCHEQLLARRFTINPVLVILSLVFWYWMWGVPGAILSTPMLAITKIICDRIRPLMAFGHFMEG